MHVLHQLEGTINHPMLRRLSDVYLPLLDQHRAKVLSLEATIAPFQGHEITGAAVSSVLAGLAGAVVVKSHQTVFATGVMVALALIPAMAIFGVGLIAGNFALAFSGLARWGVDAACVTGASTFVFALTWHCTAPGREVMCCGGACAHVPLLRSSAGILLGIRTPATRCTLTGRKFSCARSLDRRAAAD